VKKDIAWMCAAIAAACFSGAAGAEMFKCTKDGRTTYQEQPCGLQGGAETKMESSRPSAWVGCYVAKGRGFDSGRETTNDFEVRQEGSTLYIPVGMEGKNETRMIVRPASSEDLLALKQKLLGPDFKGEVLSGLAVYGTSSGPNVKPADADRGLRMGFYWVSPATEEKALYAFFPFAFDKTTKVACAGKK
jgi:hypothetical protein